MVQADSPARRRALAALVALHLLVVGATFGMMVVTGPILPQILFYKLGLEPLTAARYTGVVFQEVTRGLAILAGAALLLEAGRLALGERPPRLAGPLRYLASGVVLAAVLLFGRHYIPQVQAFHAQGPDALASPAFHAVHAGSRRVFSAGLLASAVALVLVPRR